MFGIHKHRSRRERIRENRPDTGAWRRALGRRDVLISLGIVGAFWVAAAGIMMLREEAVRYRPGQYTPQDILSRVDFTFRDSNRLIQLQQAEREGTGRIYRATGEDPWKTLAEELETLPARVADKTLEQLARATRDQLQLGDSGELTLLQSYAGAERAAQWKQWTGQFVNNLRAAHRDRPEARHWVILPDDQRQQDLGPPDQAGADRWVTLPGAVSIKARDTASVGDEQFRNLVYQQAASSFPVPLPKNIAEFTLRTLRPTHVLDEEATAEARNRAAAAVTPSRANITFRANQILVPKGIITEHHWQVLRREQSQFIEDLGRLAWKSKLGLAGVAFLATLALAVYVARYQPRVIRNHARALGIAALLLLMLLLSQLAAIGTGSLYVFGVAPTMLTAMILVIAYDSRLALGISTIQGLLVTVALDQGMGFFVILFVGICAICYLLNDVRTRSRPIEVGGAAALAMIAATAAVGGINFDPLAYIWRNVLSVGAAGLGVGFVVLGILPFIEKAFRITTSMTLLELADASQPLLRRMSIEAPGTYNHSLQLATLAEAAAEAVGANSLLCRVGAYYHDIGKVNKSDYFIENQARGVNRHINLSPSVSLLIIIGHVKDGVELAKEYNLPTILMPFIQQHHGTMLVEYFYKQACRERQAEGDGTPLNDAQYRYPGPRPRSREVAIVMLADAVESAARTMVEPNPSRIEALVHDLAIKRLLDGQFDECGLTFKELDQIERAMVKTLLGIYHGRMTYPSTAAITQGPASPASPAAPAATGA